MHFAEPIAQTPYAAEDKVGLVYFRTATTGVSYGDQMFCCRALWERENITIGATFLDYGVRGSVSPDQRSGFFALMARLRRGDVSTVLVDDVTRIARDPVIVLQACRIIEAQGAVLLTACAGRISATNLGMLFQHEHNNARDRLDQ
ncbi:recombinase family protein [Tateyamaria sp. syn59]|uniref:recombinase family protein n=1 Tax=Tateyamaria sp. syn59 TaxID=2576942 RepID=UPI0011BF5366|nr:recombinase family protein [Tateyamaria sp. syn59]